MTEQEKNGEMEEQVFSATRHVGRTLEAEGNLANVMGTELPIDLTLNHSEDSIYPDADATDPIDALDVRSVDEDKAYQRMTMREDRRRSEGEPVSPLNPDGMTLSTLPEKLNEVPAPLITRLPGDTSSDPHTDVGEDNATELDRRRAGEV